MASTFGYLYASMRRKLQNLQDTLSHCHACGHIQQQLAREPHAAAGTRAFPWHCDNVKVPKLSQFRCAAYCVIQAKRKMTMTPAAQPADQFNITDHVLKLESCPFACGKALLMVTVRKTGWQGHNSPSHDMLHARLSTPEPITAHTM